MPRADIAIIGGGIIGLATAYQLTRRLAVPRVVVLEKEPLLAAHQTGHNSGVLHSGIYYRPGSLKATNCRDGKKAMEAFCAAEDLPFEICGKVIVAVDWSEVPTLERLLERGIANGVRCERIGPERLRELEPHAAGVAAIHVPETGIVDYRAVCERLADRIRERGGSIITGACVLGINDFASDVVIRSTRGDFVASRVVACGGLHADRIAALAGRRREMQVIPFRGEYFKLRPSAEHLCRNLIYPVADPKFPFLGVHFTRMIGGGVECGPNAVLALAREGYQKSDVNLADLWETLTYPGFLRLAARHWRMGLGELWRSINKQAFVRALQRLMPAICSEDLESAPAGVRAQVITPNGALVDDFLIRERGRVVHVLNAPSPAATASLTIGQTIARRL